MESTAIDEIHCRVCNRIYDGSQHFGIEVCRACAAFFRRSVNGQKAFVCRRGGDNCQLNTPRKITCQKCRWMRCLRVGLQKESVNQRNSPTKEEKPSSISRNSSDAHLQDDSSDSLEPTSPTSPTSPTQAESYVARPIPVHLSMTLENSHLQLVHRILHNYRDFCAMRIVVEQQTSSQQDPSIVLNGRFLHKTDRGELTLIYQKQLSLLHKFLAESFDVYRRFEMATQKQILETYQPVLCQLESAYWTYRYLNVEDSTTRLVTTQSTYLEAAAADNDDISDSPSNDTWMKVMIDDVKGLLLRPMRALIILEVEFVMLLALNLWSPQLLHAMCDVVVGRLADDVRTTLFDDLHELYGEQMHMRNYAKRVGDLLSLIVDGRNGWSSWLKPDVDGVFPEPHKLRCEL